MKQSLFAVLAAGFVFGSAAAGPLCATPDELRLLKAAMLEQALTAAAQSCHQSVEFARFVAAYHAGMAKSDRDLKDFFARRKTGESYQNYKARMAAALSLRSLHDGAFCAEAKAIFDIALKHKQTKAPTLVATGYEHCGVPQMPAAKPATAQVEPALRPVKPVPVPLPVLSPAARKALALAHRSDGPQTTPPHRKPPMAVAAQQTPPAPVRPAPVAALPAKRLPLQAELVAAEPPGAPEGDTAYRPADGVPNAYKPGAYWVRSDQERELQTAPRPPARDRLVQGSDGHWYVVIGHHDRWTND